MTPRAEDQAARLRARVRGRRYQIVTITSGKGGVGKTTLTANLGLELARMGRRVLMLDGDLGLANLAILFNLAPRRDLGDVLEGRAALGDVMVDVRDNLRLIPAAAGAATLATLGERPRELLFEAVAREAADVDFLLVDTGAGISETVLALVSLADRVLLVTTHEPTALSDAYGLVKAARARGARTPEVVVNLASTHVQARATHSRLVGLTERFLDLSPALAAVIPREDCVGEAIVRQEPLSLVYPYARATRAVAALAQHLNHNQRNSDARLLSLALPDRG